MLTCKLNKYSEIIMCNLVLTKASVHGTKESELPSLMHL